jgi:hypothetical protein
VVLTCSPLGPACLLQHTTTGASPILRLNGPKGPAGTEMNPVRNRSSLAVATLSTLIACAFEVITAVITFLGRTGTDVPKRGRNPLRHSVGSLSFRLENR